MKRSVFMARAVILALLFCAFLSGCQGWSGRRKSPAKPRMAVVVNPGERFGEDLAARIVLDPETKNARIYRVKPGIAAEERIRRLAEDGFAIIVISSPVFSDDLTIAAPDFPSTAFVLFNGVVEGDNVASVEFDYSEGFVMAGALAAIATTLPLPGGNPDPVVAFIGTSDSQENIRHEKLFRLGATRINPRSKTLSFFGQSASGGKTVYHNIGGLIGEAAASGADVIVLGDASLSSIASGDIGGSSAYFIGSRSDVTSSQPGRYLAAIIPYPEKVLRGIQAEVLREEFLGSIRRPGVPENAVGLSLLRGLTLSERRLLASLDPATRGALEAQILAYRRTLPPNVGTRVRKALAQSRSHMGKNVIR